METMQKGKIGVTTDNIFPVIKKFLYSDNEIFLRELVSNAIDATRKLNTLSAFGDFKGEPGDMDVTVTIDKERGTLTVSDHGIGMTAQDIEKYINQIAFSGAEEFLAKYKDTAATIIGHFGLGFYSAFMVSSKVEIRTLSYQEGATAMRWECDGSPEYTMEPTDKTTRGTDIILHIDDENKEYLEQSRIDALLTKYCRFMPVPVRSGDRVINSTQPLWTQKPAGLTDGDYLKFYRELYPGQEDPLFWIHLNVDYPFNLTGILYFPKIKANIQVNTNRIQLYCNQVFVTDSVEGVVPEFMMLLQGVIDSPDIPLNVSRSYLQSDTAVKKISGYITKKVASRLDEMFRTDRAAYEDKWDDIKVFIEYGMLTDAKFMEQAMKFVLLKDTQGKYYTPDEYRTLVEATQTDAQGDTIYLYTTDPVAQYTFVKDATDRGYNVLVMDGELDSHFIGLLESKLEKTRFVRVDSDVIDNLIRKDDRKQASLTPLQRNALTMVFTDAIPAVKDTHFIVTFEAMGDKAKPAAITRDEYMRRMKDMAALQPGMAMFGQMPDSLNLVINTDNRVITNLLDAVATGLEPTLKPLMDEQDADNTRLADINGKKEKSAEEDQQVKDLEKAIADNRTRQQQAAKEFAAGQPVVNQVVDLALLANGLLKGEQLDAFITRSVDLLK